MVEKTPSRSMRRAPYALPWSVSMGPRWHVMVSMIMTLVIVVVLWLNRSWLVEAAGIIRTANPGLIALSFGTMLLSYLVSSQVFQIGLRSFGHHVHFMRLWTTTVTAIIISQLFPAGGIGSYAFFVSTFKRRGMNAGQATVLAALEALSYAGAMVLIGTFSIVYLVVSAVGGSAGSLNLAGPGTATAFGLAVLGGAAFMVTRGETMLLRWAVAVSSVIQRLFRLPRNDERARLIVAELVRGRMKIIAQPRATLLVILIQIAALCGHSLALLLILWALHVNIGFGVVLVAFGMTLITSTFNVLPGGGGTVETVLVTVLLHFGIGAAAVPAAIIFRLLNFWALLPIAAGSYFFMIRQPATPANSSDTTRTMRQ